MVNTLKSSTVKNDYIENIIFKTYQIWLKNMVRVVINKIVEIGKTYKYTRLGGRTTRESGFTLVELMVVVAVIAILASVAMPQFLSAADKAKSAKK